MRTAQLSFRGLFCALAACGPAVDPPPLEIQECSIEDSPTELARFPYESGPEFKTYDLGHALTVAIKRSGDETEHYLVDNCGGTPLRLQRTFGYRPGATRVGGEIVLCSGGIDAPLGVWELLENGAPGRDLGLGRSCPDSAGTHRGETGLAAQGFVWTESETTQHLPDGTVRSVPFHGRFSRVHDTWFVRSDEGEVAMFGPDGALPMLLDVPGEITHVEPPVDASPWVTLTPDSKDEDYRPLYVLDTRDGSWFPTPLAHESIQPLQVPTRDGLLVFRGGGYPWVALQRSAWDEQLPTDLDLDAGFTVVDEEHILIVNDRDVRMLRIPLDFPGDNESPYEVLWKYPVPNEGSLAGTDPGILWQDLVLLYLQGETWAFPIDGSEPYPFLPSRLQATYLGNEFITAIDNSEPSDDSRRLIRRAPDGEIEVLAEDILDVTWLNWTPELGRILYAVRDGDEVSIRQHRLTD